MAAAGEIDGISWKPPSWHNSICICYTGRQRSAVKVCTAGLFIERGPSPTPTPAGRQTAKSDRLTGRFVKFDMGHS